MKQFLIPLLLGALPVVARAQAPPATPLPPDTARVFKHELGLVIMPLLTQPLLRSPVLPVGLTYHHPVGRSGAIRLIVTGYYSQRDSLINNPLPFGRKPYKVTNGALGGWLGYEHRTPIAGRFALYYGADAGLQWRKYQVRYYAQESDIQGQATIRNFYGYQDEPVWSWQARAFAGLRFRLTPHWILAAEMGAFGAYERRYYKFEEYNQLDIGPYGELPSRNLNAFGYWRSFNTRLGFRPLQTFSLLFNF